jgi:hypothetical protein
MAATAEAGHCLVVLTRWSMARHWWRRGLCPRPLTRAIGGIILYRVSDFSGFRIALCPKTFLDDMNVSGGGDGCGGVEFPPFGG